jgi:alpha-N-acetylglucosamine transferase
MNQNFVHFSGEENLCFEINVRVESKLEDIEKVILLNLQKEGQKTDQKILKICQNGKVLTEYNLKNLEKQDKLQCTLVVFEPLQKDFVLNTSSTSQKSITEWNVSKYEYSEDECKVVQKIYQEILNEQKKEKTDS